MERADEFWNGEGDGEEVRNIASKKKSKKPPVRSTGRYVHGEDVDVVLVDEGPDAREGGDVFVASRKSKGRFCFCCIKIPDGDDEGEEEEGEVEETEKNQGKEKPEPQQLFEPDADGFIPHSHFRARNHVSIYRIA